MAKRKEWSCDNCGACCHFVGFAHPDMCGDNAPVCKHLVDGRCSIYETRPYFCNVMESYDRDFRGMSFEEFDSRMRTMCHMAKCLVRLGAV